MSKTDWEIKEELKRENFHFRRLRGIYAAINRRVAERKQRDGCALKAKVKDEMYQIICRYRKEHPEL